MSVDISLKEKEDSKTTSNIEVTKESKLVQWILVSIALIYVGLILVIPLVAVFSKALQNGVLVYIDSIKDVMTIKALRLSLITILISVPLNTIFGVIAAWAIAKFEFRGKNLLITIIDLPFAISPVIAGFIFVLLFSNSHGLLGDFLTNHDIRIIFNTPGIILATIFVTFPFVARELIPLMQSQGSTEEEAALTLGASGWKTFFLVTLPNIKWALLYGIVLTLARAAGEFGAVSVVSGHIRGVTTTLPLHVEILYNEYKFVSAFSVASLLTIIAIINLILKKFIGWKISKELEN
ncbi:sulfate ABC transporter permease protein CysW [Gottschalkia acidurici 9a]|uniref:Sulfate ABC transporter permease protein CysW n=1 Tax=Gottschalkia acidurici (strain ATCC 7906 / DSM 604 / BCRC 14475 / CIP 104303 / KCTC 5404 / NCIMB 10678 / 9a) TaxID=1128398 RepID=K0B4X7_GOTA9|nr:sulfate ABC transporter permease subunit CysW [Gottschalkia acidurici]AFS79621.1 sulfate ABC transporter permease protein CysW [Gottschalkia acidurici 9a]